MEIVLFWILLSFIVGALGSNRSTGFFGAFILSLLLSPLIGFLIVVASKRNAELPKLSEVAKHFALNKSNMSGRVDVLAVKAYAGHLKLPSVSDADIPLLTKRFFAATFNNAEIIDTFPPDSNGYIEFIYKRK